MAKAIRPTPTIAAASFGSTGDVRKADHEGNYDRDTQNQPTNHGISPALLTDRERDREALNRARAEPQMNLRPAVCSDFAALIATE